MTKNKIKLSLIDDYIKICLIKNFLNNNFEPAKLDSFYLNLIPKMKQIDLCLEQAYNEIFNLLKLNDTSLEVLKNNLSSNNKQFELIQKQQFHNCSQIIDQSNNQLKSILNSLKSKTKSLKLNINV